MAIPVPGDGPVHIVAVDGTPCPDRSWSRARTGDGLSTTVTGPKIRWVVEMMRGPELAGAKIARVEWRDLADGTVELTLHNAGPGDPPIDLEATREALLALGDAGATICIRQRKAPVREVVFAADPVPGFGWRSLPDRGGRRAHDRGRGRRDASLANEHVQVDGRSAATARWRSRSTACASRVPTGTSTAATAATPTTTRRPPKTGSSIGRRRARRGRSKPAPCARACSSIATYEWPTHAIGDERSCSARSDDTVTTEVRTTLELRTGERFLRVRVEFDNHARDHRLRAHFPLPAPVDGSSAECAFAVVRRGLTAEGGPHEFGLPTFVSRRFVDASDGDAGLALRARRTARVRGGRRRP